MKDRRHAAPAQGETAVHSSTPDAMLQALLAPVSDAAPCGEDLSYSIEFDTLVRLREADDPSLDQGEWVTPLKVADWPGIVRRASELLTRRSKDLRLAGWLTEAWAHTEGYRGLGRGLQLVTALVREHWAGLYPQPDGADQEERIGTLAWLLARVHEQARQMPVVRGKGVSYSLADVAQVRAQAMRGGDAAGAGEGDAKFSPDRLARAQRETPAAFWGDNLAAAREALAALGALQTEVDARLGADGPSFVPAREALAAAVQDIERLARESGVWVEGAALGGAAPVAAASALVPEGGQGGLTALPAGYVAGPGAAAASMAGPMAGPIASRAQALQRLQEVAEYFRRTEPHSPVAYLADKAVQWGNMPLHEWLRVVLKDAGSLSHVEELLGIPSPDAGHDAG